MEALYCPVWYNNEACEEAMRLFQTPSVKFACLLAVGAIVIGGGLAFGTAMTPASAAPSTSIAHASER